MHKQFAVIAATTREAFGLAPLVTKLIDAGLEIAQAVVDSGKDGLLSLTDAQQALDINFHAGIPVLSMPDSNWVIFSPSEAAASGGAGYWSNLDGWVSADSATVFNALERISSTLPVTAADDADWLPVESFATGFRLVPPPSKPEASFAEFKMLLEFDEDEDHRTEEVVNAASADAAEAEALESHSNARVVAVYQRVR